jgi:hypothetical protein
MANQTCEIDVFPQIVVCACTSAEGHKKRLLGEKLAKGQNELLITSANTRGSEEVFNQLRKPDWIAALKVVQQIPREQSQLMPFVTGVLAAELGRQFPQVEPDKVVQKSIDIYDDMLRFNIPFTLTATDVVLTVDHPEANSHANINQPGNVDDNELFRIIRSKVGDCDNPCLQGGLIPAKFSVGMAACEINLTNGLILGQSGVVKSDFLFQPIPDYVVAQYVADYGDRARRVNGGIMWEYFCEYIELIGGKGREDKVFSRSMDHLMAMTSGIPMEMSGFFYDLSRRHYLKSRSCVKQTTSEMRKIALEYLDRSMPKDFYWHSWYLNY